MAFVTPQDFSKKPTDLKLKISSTQAQWRHSGKQQCVPIRLQEGSPFYAGCCPGWLIAFAQYNRGGQGILFQIPSGTHPNPALVTETFSLSAPISDSYSQDVTFEPVLKSKLGFEHLVESISSSIAITKPVGLANIPMRKLSQDPKIYSGATDTCFIASGLEAGEIGLFFRLDSGFVTRNPLDIIDADTIGTFETFTIEGAPACPAPTRG